MEADVGDALFPRRQFDVTGSTMLCENPLFGECPADCGKSYNAVKDCYDCPCGVGEEGDIHVQFDEPCPPGTDFREAGAFFKACGPIDTLREFCFTACMR